MADGRRQTESLLHDQNKVYYRYKKKNIRENLSLYTEAQLTKTPCTPEISTSSIGVGNIDLIIVSNHLVSISISSGESL